MYNPIWQDLYNLNPKDSHFILQHFTIPPLVQASRYNLFIFFPNLKFFFTLMMSKNVDFPAPILPSIAIIADCLYYFSDINIIRYSN
jgi:hypothetical protein